MHVKVKDSKKLKASRMQITMINQYVYQKSVGLQYVGFVGSSVVKSFLVRRTHRTPAHNKIFIENTRGLSTSNDLSESKH